MWPFVSDAVPDAKISVPFRGAVIRELWSAVLPSSRDQGLSRERKRKTTRQRRRDHRRGRSQGTGWVKKTTPQQSAVPPPFFTWDRSHCRAWLERGDKLTRMYTLWKWASGEGGRAESASSNANPPAACSSFDTHDTPVSSFISGRFLQHCDHFGYYFFLFCFGVTTCAFSTFRLLMLELNLQFDNISQRKCSWGTCYSNVYQ